MFSAQFNYAGFAANLLTNYVGKQYLDNTSNRNAMLDDYCVSNLRVAYTLDFEKNDARHEMRDSKKFIKNITFNILINNLFNTRYKSNGGVYSYFEGANADGKYSPENQQHIPWYYAQAGINVHGGFTINF